MNITFVLGLVLLVLAVVGWRYCVMEDRWYNVCQTIGSTDPHEVYNRLAKLVAIEVVHGRKNK